MNIKNLSLVFFAINNFSERIFLDFFDSVINDKNYPSLANFSFLLNT